MDFVVFTQRVEILDDRKERRDSIDQKVSLFIRQCGFLPLALPNNPKIAIEIIEAIKPKGIILTGGNTSVIYGGNAPERDETDFILLQL